MRHRAGNVPQHRATARVWRTRALARHQPYLALGALAGAAALASGVMLILPGHAAQPAARGCGLVTCATWRHTPLARAPQPRLSPRYVSPRSVSHAVARLRRAPAQPAVPVPATPVPAPSTRQLGHHHGQGHRRHGHGGDNGQ